jgi:hypothetical protein
MEEELKNKDVQAEVGPCYSSGALSRTSQLDGLDSVPSSFL